MRMKDTLFSEDVDESVAISGDYRLVTPSRYSQSIYLQKLKKAQGLDTQVLESVQVNQTTGNRVEVEFVQAIDP